MKKVILFYMFFYMGYLHSQTFNSQVFPIYFCDKSTGKKDALYFQFTDEANKASLDDCDSTEIRSNSLLVTAPFDTATAAKYTHMLYISKIKYGGMEALSFDFIAYWIPPCWISQLYYDHRHLLKLNTSETDSVNWDKSSPVFDPYKN